MSLQPAENLSMSESILLLRSPRLDFRTLLLLANCACWFQMKVQTPPDFSKSAIRQRVSSMLKVSQLAPQTFFVPEVLIRAAGPVMPVFSAVTELSQSSDEAEATDMSCVCVFVVVGSSNYRLVHRFESACERRQCRRRSLPPMPLRSRKKN